MRLENIVALTNGRLVNDPFVKKFENIVFEAKSVKRGDLFIAFDESMIEEAIFNGAYGVIFDKPTQISDLEIAWIKVKNCDDSLKRLIRFRLIEQGTRVYECNEVVLKLSLQVMTDTDFIPIMGNTISIHKQIWNMDDKSILLFCPTLTDKDIFTNVKQLPDANSDLISIKEKTLFETSFIYENIFYERQLLSPLFIPYLEQLLSLYKSLDIKFRLRKFSQIENFEAVFVNNNFEMKEFGSTDKVVVFEKNKELVDLEIEFLNENSSWANKIYIIPFSDKELYNNYENIFRYKREEEILRILKKNSFHFALVVGVDKSILPIPITHQAQLSLF